MHGLCQTIFPLKTQLLGLANTHQMRAFHAKRVIFTQPDDACGARSSSIGATSLWKINLTEAQIQTGRHKWKMMPHV
jgi:hypothetical protein